MPDGRSSKIGHSVRYAAERFATCLPELSGDAARRACEQSEQEEVFHFKGLVEFVKYGDATARD
jgi:hypothetical protein